jgi:hypothetical protein
MGDWSVARPVPRQHKTKHIKDADLHPYPGWDWTHDLNTKTAEDITGALHGAATVIATDQTNSVERLLKR